MIKKLESDQDPSTLGIRDIIPAEGEFTELENFPSDRRDPEESRYDEAGKRILTQGDIEMEKIQEAL